MNIRRIVFWQEPLSPHQSPWIRALADKFDGRVIGVFQAELSQERIALGWKPPDYGKTGILIAPALATANRLLDEDPEGTVHVFSSMVSNPLIHSYFKRALGTRARVGVLSEGRDWRSWMGGLRMIHALFNEHSYRKSVDFVLTIGTVGEEWYRRCGYDSAKIFPFCYVVETPSSESRPVIAKASVQVVAIGQLILRKRFDLLLKALATQRESQWTLKIIGHGPLRESLESMADNLGIKERVTFTGALDNLEVRTELARTNIFVLPSRWDGWGAVVNEALMGGVPVLCSDFCGAADLIQSGFNGDLFRCDSLESLIPALNKWISKGQLSDIARNKIRNWSRCIEGESVAQYFIEIMDHVAHPGISRPTAPWKKTVL